MSNKTNLISINNFSFGYSNSKTLALREVNLNIQKNNFILLAGHSGCGKSTLLRCLNGIIPNIVTGEANGDIYIKGKNIKDLTPESISKIAGSVFQNPRSQFFHLDVTDEVAFGPENLGLSRCEILKRVDKAFDAFDINHLRQMKMYELSSGEKQKVAFAAIYATGSEILFLDEPSANLDFKSIENLKNILEFLKNQGKTIIIAEHRIHYLEKIFDKIVILKNGLIQAIHPNSKKIPKNVISEYGLRTLNLKKFVDNHSKISNQSSFNQKNINIKLNSINFKYPHAKKAILNNISLDFIKGEKIAIIGANGSGKTTFIKLLCGLLKPSKGRFFDRNNNIMNSSMRLNNCGVVLQENSQQLFFSSVIDEINSVEVTNCDYSAQKILKHLGLDKYENCHPQNLSAGQQQRLIFAIATINYPRLLILDEPTSGLDAYSMHAIGDEICKIADKGSSVIIVTHDFELVSLYCDAALLLREGQTLERIERNEFNSKLPIYQETAN